MIWIGSGPSNGRRFEARFSIDGANFESVFRPVGHEMGGLQERYRRTTKRGTHGGRQSIALTACMLLSTYYAALRGEEVVRVDLGHMLKYWEEAMTHEVKHVQLMLTGRFKQVVREKLFCQPLAHTTKGVMDMAQWFERAIASYVVNGVRSGPLFRTNKANVYCKYIFFIIIIYVGP